MHERASRAEVGPERPRHPGEVRATARARVRAATFACAVLLALAPLVGCRTRPADEAPFDVVVVALDGLRADRLSLFGNQRSTAPAVEALARESVTYARAVSPATWSVPAVASISTGRWPSWHGAERLVVPGSDGGAPTAREIAEDATTL
ncbi:MAG: sulfatase-like hydrolase/transferase, partial [Alphaproteobacteria bacterium]